jgi:fructose-1,6-bisphosphatase I
MDDTISLKKFLSEKGTDPRLSELILSLCDQARIIRDSFHLRSASKKPVTQNIFNEVQMNFDTYANDVFVGNLKKNRFVRYIASEEENQILEINNPLNDFGIVIDPIDGSSLLDVNLTVGSIIGIYPGYILEKGSLMIAAFYFLYGPCTTLTLTVGAGVHEFVMDEQGEFYLTTENIRIPDGTIYAPGALRKDYLSTHAKWIRSLEQKGYKLRFSGSFVADVHQILHKGGVFTYPSTKRNKKGKLRLLYEAVPMGRIVHEAGGAASNGKTNILDIMPASITDTTPVYIGGKREIHDIQTMMAD